MPNAYKVVKFLQRLYRFGNIQPHMMAKDGFKNKWEQINYGRFINQFRPDIITSIRQLERIKTKIY